MELYDRCMTLSDVEPRESRGIDESFVTSLIFVEIKPLINDTPRWLMELKMYTYEEAVKQLQETGSISLINFKELSYEDLEELLEEIKKWCVYANGNKEKLEKKSKKKDKKKKNK